MTLFLVKNAGKQSKIFCTEIPYRNRFYVRKLCYGSPFLYGNNVIFYVLGVLGGIRPLTRCILGMDIQNAYLAKVIEDKLSPLRLRKGFSKHG